MAKIRHKLILTGTSGQVVSQTASAVDVALRRHITDLGWAHVSTNCNCSDDTDCTIPIISICKTRDGKRKPWIYEVCESDFRRGKLVTILDIAFNEDERDDAISLFLKLLTDPLCRRLSAARKQIGPFRFLKDMV